MHLYGFIQIMCNGFFMRRICTPLRYLLPGLTFICSIIIIKEIYFQKSKDKMKNSKNLSCNLSEKSVVLNHKKKFSDKGERRTI